jgi:hypothetical protein
MGFREFKRWWLRNNGPAWVFGFLALAALVWLVVLLADSAQGR